MPSVIVVNKNMKTIENDLLNKSLAIKELSFEEINYQTILE